MLQSTSKTYKPRYFKFTSASTYMRTYVQKTCVWQAAPPRASMHATRIAYVHRLVATVATVAPTQQLTTHLHTRTTTATTTTNKSNSNSQCSAFNWLPYPWRMESTSLFSGSNVAAASMHRFIRKYVCMYEYV